MKAFHFLMVLGFTYFYTKEHFLDLCTNNFSFRGGGVYQYLCIKHLTLKGSGFYQSLYIRDYSVKKLTILCT